MTGHAGQTANGKRLDASIAAVQEASAMLASRSSGAAGLKPGDHARITDKLWSACDRLSGALGTFGAMMADTATAAGEHDLAADYARMTQSAAAAVQEAAGLLRAAGHALRATERAHRGDPAGGTSGTVPLRTAAKNLADQLGQVEILRLGDVDIGTHSRVVLLYRQIVNALRVTCNAESLAVDDCLEKLGNGRRRPFTEAHHVDEASNYLGTADTDLTILQGLL